MEKLTRDGYVLGLRQMRLIPPPTTTCVPPPNPLLFGALASNRECLPHPMVIQPNFPENVPLLRNSSPPSQGQQNLDFIQPPICTNENTSPGMNTFIGAGRTEAAVSLDQGQDLMHFGEESHEDLVKRTEVCISGNRVSMDGNVKEEDENNNQNETDKNNEEIGKEEQREDRESVKKDEEKDCNSRSVDLQTSDKSKKKSKSTLSSPGALEVIVEEESQEDTSLIISSQIETVICRAIKRADQEKNTSLIISSLIESVIRRAFLKATTNVIYKEYPVGRIMNSQNAEKIVMFNGYWEPSRNYVMKKPGQTPRYKNSIKDVLDPKKIEGFILQGLFRASDFDSQFQVFISMFK